MSVGSVSERSTPFWVKPREIVLMIRLMVRWKGRPEQSGRSESRPGERRKTSRAQDDLLRSPHQFTAVGYGQVGRATRKRGVVRYDGRVSDIQSLPRVRDVG